VHVSLEPLSTEYFDQLSAAVGDAWVRLAENLKLGRPAIQRITRSNAQCNSSTERSQRSARDTLYEWFRSSTKSEDKVRNFSSEFCQIISRLINDIYIVLACSSISTRGPYNVTGSDRSRLYFGQLLPGYDAV